MRINSLNIEYFRNFRKYQITFGRRVNVIVGLNGAGKSNCINALHKALSFIFSSSAKEQSLGAVISSLHTEQFDKNRDYLIDSRTREAFPYIQIAANGEFEGVVLDWKMYAPTTTFKVWPKYFSKALTLFTKKRQEANKLPLLAYFSDSYPHKSANDSEANSKWGELRNFGYYQWNDETASVVWLNRLQSTLKQYDKLGLAIAKREVKKQELPLGEERKALEVMNTRDLKQYLVLDNEIGHIRSRLVAFSAKDERNKVVDIVIDEKEELCVVYANGASIAMDKLPAGYSRLYNMVIDVAYRSFILNQNTDSEGIVIIDEIDLHLHPSLERMVLSMFTNTFPNIQFIVSTHSPKVVADVNADENNKIILMRNGDETPLYLPSLHGLDYESIVSDFMDGNMAQSELEKLKEDYRTYRDMDMEEEMRGTLDKIRSIVGEGSQIEKYL